MDGLLPRVERCLLIPPVRCRGDIRRSGEYWSGACFRVTWQERRFANNRMTTRILRTVNQIIVIAFCLGSLSCTCWSTGVLFVSVEFLACKPSGLRNPIYKQRNMIKYRQLTACMFINGSFSDNFNFSMKKASRTYNFCFISNRHVVFNWQSVGQIKTRLNAQRYKKIETSLFFGSFNVLNFYRHDLLF